MVIVLMAVLGSREVRSEVERKREDLMTDIPLFMCLMSTLLEAGMQLPKAIEICAKAFGDNKNLSLEIKNIRAMMLSGISASDAVEAFSLRVQIPEAQAALLLVARYGRLGTSEVLNLLQLQSQSCWDLCRNAQIPVYPIRVHLMIRNRYFLSDASIINIHAENTHWQADSFNVAAGQDFAFRHFK